MPRRPRTYYTDTQKALMSERWKKGETLHQIANLFAPHTSIRGVLAETGGIRPAERRPKQTSPQGRSPLARKNSRAVSIQTAGSLANHQWPSSR